MEFSSEAQTFLSIMLTGMFLGCIFDICRTVRNTFKLRTIGTAATDILYWTLAAAFVFFVLIIVNQGQIRFYIFIALILGASLYFYFCSRRVLVFLFSLVRLAHKTKIWVRQTLRTIFYTLLVKPFRFFYPILSKPLQDFKKLCQRLLPRKPPPC